MHDKNIQKFNTDTHTKVNVTHWLAHVLVYGCSGGYIITLCSAAVFQLDLRREARDPLSVCLLCQNHYYNY